jgi:hypothetical protein
VTGQDIESILQRADKLLEESKSAYEDASSKNSVQGFIDAGFRLEEARIKYLVLQEIGSPEKQTLAGQRLRTVNQLSKLIHDGKVAVGGTPAVPAPPQPPDPGPVKPPPAAGDLPAKPAPSPKAVDATKRAALPDATKQKEAEKLVKDLYKERYGKKEPGERKALAHLLLDQAARSQEDPAAMWVLYREAQDLATQICDVRLALEVVDATSRVFDIDSAAMRAAALAASAKAARAPEEFTSLSRAYLALTDEFVRADQFESAEKAAASALQHARVSRDADLIPKSTSRTKEVAEAKTLYQSMKAVMTAQARNPDDPAANLDIGRFLCFVKGSWDLGLRFIVKGSDLSLKALAERELSLPSQVADRVSLADGWYELGEKERSPLKKSQLLAHAKSIYESALPDSAALVRAKIEKRLADLESSGPGAARVDLLRVVDPRRDSVQGAWRIENQTLVSPMEAFPRIQFPYAPPSEYDLTLVVERKATIPGPDAGGLYAGLVGGEKQFGVEIDAGGKSSGIWVSEKGGTLGASVRGSFLSEGRAHSIVYKVRASKVEVRVDGSVVLDWPADYSKVWIHPSWKASDARVLYLGAYKATYIIKQVSLLPVTGSGKLTR